MKSEDKKCQNCQKDFTIESEDFDFYKKMKVPAPTFCPDCRSQRRLSWRNDTTLYNRECGLCKKSIISIYSPESNINTFCNKCWWGDGWDPQDYARDYDFSKNFFEQFINLVREVPHLTTINDDGVGSVNCEYTQDFGFSKNCYMVFIAWKIENVMYSYYLIGGKEMVDCMNVMTPSEWLYECIQPDGCYQVKYAHLVSNCLNSQFLYDCRNCPNCFLCAGLRNKKYCFRNQQYSKKEYEKILASYELDTFSGVEKAQQEFDEFILKTPRRYAHVIKSVNCSGDFLTNSKNSHQCFNIQSAENCKWVDNSDFPKDSYDMSTGGELSESYECITCDHSNRNFFGIYSWKNHDVEYTHHCHNCKNCFGCVGLRNKSYYIFNKQYSKEEYFGLVKKIKQQMDEMPYIDKKRKEYGYGEFYPAELSYFGYNESEAAGRFVLSRKEALAQGFNWQENIQKTSGLETIKLSDLPESIDDIKDSILEEILSCLDCGRNFKITKNELDFYRRLKIPIPRRCFHCRHDKRVERRGPFQLWHRTCMKDGCDVEFETTYAPERPEIVYCEQCYQKEMI